MIHIEQTEDHETLVKCSGPVPEVARELATGILNICQTFNQNIGEGAGHVFLEIVGEYIGALEEKGMQQTGTATFIPWNRRDSDGT